MTLQKTTASEWIPAQRLLLTTLSGDIDAHDLDIWETSLQKALSAIPVKEKFKILVNLHGFTAIDTAVHKKFRNVIPLTLAAYNWRVGYVDLFPEEAKALKYTKTRGISCFGAAHCHHDATKIELYQSKFSRPDEHYFTDPEEAKAWLETLPFPDFPQV